MRRYDKTWLDKTRENTVHIILLWNLNGWGRDKHESLVNIFLFYDPDLIAVNETWFLKDRPDYNVPNYTFYLNNRKEVHKNARKGSGGVGILIHDRVLQQFKVTEVNDCFDDIILVRLIHKLNKAVSLETKKPLLSAFILWLKEVQMTRSTHNK